MSGPLKPQAIKLKNPGAPKKEKAMAGKTISAENIKAFLHSQVHDPDKWDLNKKLLRAIGIFGGSIVLMSQYGDLMAI